MPFLHHLHEPLPIRQWRPPPPMSGILCKNVNPLINDFSNAPVPAFKQQCLELLMNSCTDKQITTF